MPSLTSGQKGLLDSAAPGRYDEVVEQQRQSSPLAPIFQRIALIQSFQEALTPFLRARLPQSFSFEIANFRKNTLVILTPKATSIRLLRAHQEAILEHLNSFPELPSTQTLVFKVTPRFYQLKKAA